MSSERVAHVVWVWLGLVAGNTHHHTPPGHVGRKVLVELSAEDARALGEALIRHAESAVKPAGDRS